MRNQEQRRCIPTILSDNDPANFLPIRINAPYGTDVPFNVRFENNLMYLGMTNQRAIGFVELLGLQPVNEAITSDEGATIGKTISERISDDIESLEASILHKIRAFRGAIGYSLPYRILRLH